MKNAMNEIQLMRDAWSNVCTAHAGQVELAGLGYGSMNARELLTVFDNWKAVVGQAIEKTTPRQELYIAT